MTEFIKGVTECSEKVRRHRCGHKAVVEREGKPYCTIHDPEYIKEKNRKREEKWDAERQVAEARFALQYVRNAVTAGLTLEDLKGITPQMVKATPKMYETLKMIAACVSHSEGDIVDLARKALALAEVGEGK